MKKILFILGLFLAFAADSQPLNYTRIANRYRWISGMFDSALYVPRYNGTPSGVRVGENSAIDGAIAIDTANHRAYIYSGGAWLRLANYAEIPAAYTAGDGLLLTGSDFKVLTKRSITIDNDSVMLVNDSTASPASYFYGTNSAGRKGWYAQSGITVAPMVDSIYRVPGTDSIYYVKNGITYALKDSTGGGNGVDSIYRVPGTDSIYYVKNGITYALKDSTGGGSSSVNVADSLSWVDVRYYGALDDGVEYTDGAISTGTAILTSATAGFTSGDVGKVIRVGGAGSGGDELFTTIAGYTNSTTVTLTDNASSTVTNQRFIYGTDNTEAIQNAINAAVSGAAASGTVIFRKENTGRYLISDTLVTASNSQLYIPVVAYSPSASQKSLRLLGQQMQTNFIDYANGQKSSNAGIIIQSMINDSAGAILGSSYSTSLYGYHNWTQLYIENLTFRTVSLNGTTNIEPKMSGLDLYNMNMVDLRNVIVHTESDNYNSVRPDTATFGIRLPSNNNGGYVWLTNVEVERFNSGIIVTENLNADNVWINACYNGWEFGTGTHPNYIKKTLVEWCVNGMLVSGSRPNIRCDLYTIETYPTSIATKWFNTVYDFNVSTGLPGKGSLYYYRVKAGVGPQIDSLTRNDNALTSDYVFTKYNETSPIEINRDSTIQYRLISAEKPSVLAKINTTNGADLLFTRANVAGYAVGFGDSTNTTENFHLYSYARSKYDMFINSSGNMLLGGTDARATQQLTLFRSTGNANFGIGGDSTAFQGAVNIYRSNTATASGVGNGSAIHFVNPSATGRINMTYRVNGQFTGSFSSDYTGNNSFDAFPASTAGGHTFYVNSVGKQLINSNGVLITGDQIMHGTTRKLYWTNSGNAADANWKTGYETTPSGAALNTGAAVVTDVYGGATTYGFTVRKTGGSSIFELQGSNGQAYFSGSVGIGTGTATTKLQVAGRMAATQGADVASANNLTLGSDGNSFEITAATQINLITSTGWINGSIINLIFTSTPTVKNGQATSGANVTIMLAGAADFVASADDILTLMLCEVGGTQAWREVSRSVN